MGAKYRVEYKDYFQNNWVVEISNDAYTGGLIYLRGVGQRACEIVRDCDDNPYTTIVNTKANINVYQDEAGSIDILELQTAQDKDFSVVVKVNDVYQFYGYLIPDGIQQSFQAAPFELNLVATDGLMLLDSIPYTHNNLPGGRVIINYFRQILFNNPNLGLPLPIKWVNTLTNDAFPDEEDVFSGSVLWSARGEGFTDYQGNFKSCLYILEGLLKSMQCRIVQAEGYWVIWRVNDVVSGDFSYRTTSTDQSGLVISDPQPVNVNATLGSENRKMVMEDAILTVLPALKTVKTTYTQEQRENVLPNGNMDLISFGQPLYWGFTGSIGLSSFEIRDSIYDDRGYSVQVNSRNNQGKFFELVAPLPIDSEVLYSTMNVGFKFMPISGFPVDANGIIQWGSPPFFYVVTFYDNNGTTWYMNEFGFWVDSFRQISPAVANLKLLDVAQIDFNKFQNVPILDPTNKPIDRTNPPSLKVSFFIPAVCAFALDDIYIKVGDNSDVYEGTVIGSSTNTAKEEIELNISSDHNGFHVSNLMSSFDQSGAEKFYSDSRLTAATLTEMNTHAVLCNRYLPSLILEGSIYGNDYRYDEIYNIPQFPGKKFLPLRSTWNTETNVTNLTMVEIRNDSLTVDMKHYGSNDKTNLSN